MKWIRDTENDAVVSLADDTGKTVIFGQIIREPVGWTAHDYVSNNGTGRKLGVHGSEDLAKQAVETSLSEVLRAKKT